MSSRRAKQLRKGVYEFMQKINADMKGFTTMYRRVKKNYVRGIA